MSSRSTTPQQRTREEDTNSEQDDLENTISLPRSKRRRLDDDLSESDRGESYERPLLPDTYRRSPKGKERARDAITTLADSHDRQDHHPGSIVRVKLTDFVTYSKAEFLPGPNLNMVIGPNGTGKSTLVCAICIGLGWNTSHLGRAKDVTEFVKHGCKSAEIEIELKADPTRHERNPIITHRINKDGGSGKSSAKSTFLIDGKKSTGKAVQELARSFYIQVNNLCQFLPQDRVVEFAALSPVDLLAQTLQAAAPEQMSVWHAQLKDMHREEKQKQKDQQGALEQLKNMEDRQRSQAVEVERLRERDAKKEEKRILEKLRPFAEYEILKQRHAQAKAHVKTVKKELRVLEQKMQPNVDAVENKRAYHGRLDTLVGSRDRMVARGEADAEVKLQKYRTTVASVDEAEQEIAAENKGGKDNRGKILELERSMNKIENALRGPRPEFDAEVMNHTMGQKRQQIRQLNNSLQDLEHEMESLREQGKQRHQIIKDEERKREFLQSQAGKQTSKLESVSVHAARAWRWIQENRERFVSKVYGPAMIECSVKDVRYASQVETIVGPADLMAFTVTSQDDYRMLDHQLHRVMRLSDFTLRVSTKPLDSFHPPCSNEQLQHLGFERWLLELIDGPEAVLAMLCDNKMVNQIAFTSRDISNAQFTRFENSAISGCVTATRTYAINRRRDYGAFTSTRVGHLKPAKLLTDAEVNTQEEQDIGRNIAQAKGELGIIDQELQATKRQYSDKKAEIDDVSQELKSIEDEKKKKQSERTEYDGLQTRLEGVAQKLADARASNAGRSDRILAIFEKQDNLCLQKGQEALDYARALESVRKLHEQLLEAEIMRIEAKSDLEQLEARNEDEHNLLEQKRVQLEQAEQEKQGVYERGSVLQRECQNLGDNLTAEEGEAYERLVAEGWDHEKLENDIVQLQASLEMLHGGNEGMIAEYEKRASKIDDRKRHLQDLERSLIEISSQITEIREQWEPQLDQLIGQISDAFAENFSRIQCAGEVAVHKDDDFDEWSIQIKVKFREHEQLSVLDAHRQSGGERAVSTIFYLMALQSLARAPFRVVDEINQGMDPRNERLVHSRMVEIACAEHTSQYFLITPKLLNNLTYHANMKVHCIASGEYMPKDHRELDFQMLARKALEIRAATTA